MEMDAHEIKPGLNIRIVTEIDVTLERISVKASVVYDVKGERIIVAQTDPPMLRSKVQTETVITFLAKEKNVTRRYGCTARIVEFIDYVLSSGQPVQAVVMERAGEAQPYNIRMFYRVAPTGRSGISMTIYETPVHVLDISLGGAKISYERSLELGQDSIVKASVEMNGRTYGLEGLILRTWEGNRESMSRDLRFASMEFTNMSNTVELALLQKIRDIERESFRKEKLS